MVWKHGILFLLSLNRRVLMKYNIENMLQKHIVLEIVIWFPNFWVRKLFVVKEK